MRYQPNGLFGSKHSYRAKILVPQRSLTVDAHGLANCVTLDTHTHRRMRHTPTNAYTPTTQRSDSHSIANQYDSNWSSLEFHTIDVNNRCPNGRNSDKERYSNTVRSTPTILPHTSINTITSHSTVLSSTTHLTTRSHESWGRERTMLNEQWNSSGSC